MTPWRRTEAPPGVEACNPPDSQAIPVKNGYIDSLAVQVVAASGLSTPVTVELLR